MGIGGQPTLDVNLNGLDKRKHVPIKDKNSQAIKVPLYTVIWKKKTKNFDIFFVIQGDDDISGEVEVKLNKSKKLEHTGIRIELIGHIGNSQKILFLDEKKQKKYINSFLK